MEKNVDPWALLREARQALSQGCWNGSCCVVRARIDAALAAHRDEGSTEDVVAWDEGENYEGKHWWDTMIGDRAVHVEALDKGGTRFYWRVFSTLDEEGHQLTLDKAKSAAIATARGMR
jgi:hypothetical protein